ncbi:NAD(P)/FAD-dependent oxidoreductase [soil metagenome]
MADLAVLGAGPAGLAAAVTAAERGLSVVLVDSAEQTGGQFWRHPDERHLESFTHPESTGHHHWDHYRQLRDRLNHAVAERQVTYLAGTQVWRIDRGAHLLLRTTKASGADTRAVGDRTVRATRLILATGAYDRQLPVPGWTTPGVMAAGGVHALLKANQVRAGSRAVVAGTGPFLLSVAASLADAGVEVVALCDANALSRWARTPVRAIQEPAKLIEGVGYAATFIRHRIPLRTRTIVTRIAGTDRATQVVLGRVDGRGRVRPGSEWTVDADLVALGWGFTPHLELAVGLGLQTRIDADASLVAIADADQRSSVEGVYLAGEVCGVGGAIQSCAEGELAALTVAADAGRPDDARARSRLRRRVARGRRFAIGMHRASPVPAEWQSWLHDDTTVCRCEEVSAGEVRSTVRSLGADDPRDVRVTARPGMGMCQGRVCGFAVACLVATATGRPATSTELEQLVTRPLATPMRVADLALLARKED